MQTDDPSRAHHSHVRGRSPTAGPIEHKDGGAEHTRAEGTRSASRKQHEETKREGTRSASRKQHEETKREGTRSASRKQHDEARSASPPSRQPSAMDPAARIAQAINETRARADDIYQTLGP